MKKFKSLLAALLCTAILIPTLFSCLEANKDPKTQANSYYDYFDTVSVIMSYKGDTPEEFAANCEAVSRLLSEYHKLFDIYYEYAGVNNIKTVNKNAGKEPVRVDGRLIDFLLYCKEIYTLTEGKTNVAMGSVLKLWHDEREHAESFPDEAALPESEALRTAKEHVDINSIIIDKAASTIFISDPCTQIDVGAIGKGYAAQKAAELLEKRGVSSYVLNVGGNLCAIGEKPSGNGWVTGITNPDKTSDEAFVCKVELKNSSLVTSGDYERYYTVGGIDYHHIIDPVTLMPANYFRSVSVFCTDSGLADALSTALFCMNYEDGLRVAKKAGAEVVWVYHSGEVVMTDGVKLAKNK